MFCVCVKPNWTHLSDLKHSTPGNIWRTFMLHSGNITVWEISVYSFCCLHYLGTPGGGALFGREGTEGGGPGSGDTAGRPGGPGAARPAGRGGPGGARRWGVGLDMGDLRRDQINLVTPCTLGTCVTPDLSPQLPASGWHSRHLQPGVVDRWRHRCGDSGGADVTDDAEACAQSVVHPEHLITVLSLRGGVSGFIL